MTILNKHLLTVKPSATLAINERVKQKRQQLQKVVHWGFGQSPFEVPNSMQQALIKNVDNKQYLPGQGLPELRQAISEHYQAIYQYQYQEQDVFIAPGSKEALFQLLYLLDGPLLLPAPSWVSYEPQAKLLGKEVCWLATDFDDRYLLTLQTLEQWCKQNASVKQSVLLLNSPNNPTGQQYDANTLEALAKICRQNNILVISDEIYAGVSFCDEAYASMAHYYPEGTIVTAGLSKLFSAGGYRLGFAMIPSQMGSLKQAMLVMISETYSCVSSPIQFAALDAYQNYQTHLPYLEKYNQCHQLVASYLHQSLVSLGVLCHPGQGAFYLMPSFKPFQQQLHAQGVKTDFELCEFLLDKYQLAMLPGSDFGMASEALTTRIATVDYDGTLALSASSIDAACFANIRQGIELLAGALAS